MTPETMNDETVSSHPVRDGFRGPHFRLMIATFAFMVFPRDVAGVGSLRAWIIIVTGIVVHGFFAIALLAVIRRTNRSRIVFGIVLLLAAVSVLGHVVDVLKTLEVSGAGGVVAGDGVAGDRSDGAFMSGTPRLLEILLYGSIIISMLRHVLRPGVVDLDRIFGSICVYFLIGVAWAVAYRFALDFDSDAISGLAQSASERTGELLYFSFTTLTTLGYGDILPRSELARNLSSVEAITGQMYVAVLVARLVALHVAHDFEAKRRSG